MYPLKINEALRDAVLPPAQNASDFIIYHVDETGRPCRLYDPKDSMSTCVVKSINICRQMLKTDTVRTALIEQATKYSKLQRGAWFSEQGPADAKKKMEALTDEFLGKVSARFPSMFVDDSLHKTEYMAVHWRHEWDGEFETSNQYISLNGEDLQYMRGAAIASSNTDHQNPDNRDHRTFLFMIANYILHEIGHVFFTFLTQGRAHTPPQMKARVKGGSAGADHTKGESGYQLEQKVFGGALMYVQDPVIETPANHCGTPYVRTKTGWYRITQAAVDMTVKSGEKLDENYQFDFPYSRSNIDESGLDFKSMGHGDPKNMPEDPLAHPDWPKLRDAPVPAGR